MSLTCPKCDAPRAPNSDPAASCPSCGIIYAKYDPEAAAELKARQEAVRRGEKVERMDRQAQELFRTAPRAAAKSDPEGGITQRQLIGLLGAAVLAIGVFMPLLSGPLGMSINYFSNGKGDGVTILALAVCTVALVLTRKYRLLWATGGLSLAVLAFTFVRMQAKISDVQEEMNSNLQGNPFRGLADAAMASVQMQWGWAVLAIGAVLILACAGMKTGQSESKGYP